jgi:hypothetical protein
LISVTWISETRLDRAAFLPVAKQVTGHNHVSAADRKPASCPLGDELTIMRDFAAKDVDMAPTVIYVGFLFAGFAHDIQEVIEYTRGMTHLYTSLTTNPMLASAVVTGNLSQWRFATIDGCKAHPMSTARAAYNKVYNEFRKRGLYDVFEGFRVHDQPDGTFLLLEHK